VINDENPEDDDDSNTTNGITASQQKETEKKVSSKPNSSKTKKEYKPLKRLVKATVAMTLDLEYTVVKVLKAQKKRLHHPSSFQERSIEKYMNGMKGPIHFCSRNE
jgi:hypothetical protein